MTKPPEIQSVMKTKFAKIALFSDPGVGKTRLLGSSPGRVLVIRPPTDHTESMNPADKARVEEWVIEDWDGMNQALDYLRQEGEQWDWVWLDSVSLMYDHLLDDLWETVVREKPARARYGLDKAEYGINMFRLGQWVRHIVGPDKFNFGFTAHVADLLPSEDPEETKKLMPWIQGKNMSPKLCGYMNIVAFMEVAKIGGKQQRVLRLNATERYYAKDQFDLTTDGRIVNPTMPKIVSLIEASRAKAEAATPKKKAAPVRRRVTKRT